MAPVWDLPFADAEVDEILAIHVLEHVHPALVESTLREWRRVLSPGGVARIHVPNAPAICRAFEQGDTATKWATINALFGYYGGPEVDDGRAISLDVASPDHKVMFDLALLEHVLHRAGFDQVADRSDGPPDRHIEAWAELVPGYSLVVEASSSQALAAPADPAAAWT